MHGSFSEHWVHPCVLGAAGSVIPQLQLSHASQRVLLKPFLPWFHQHGLLVNAVRQRCNPGID